MRILHLLKTEPDETVMHLFQHLCKDAENSVVELFDKNLDWLTLVDEIFDHDDVVCWW